MTIPAYTFILNDDYQVLTSRELKIILFKKITYGSVLMRFYKSVFTPTQMQAKIFDLNGRKILKNFSLFLFTHAEVYAEVLQM